MEGGHEGDFHLVLVFGSRGGRTTSERPTRCGPGTVPEWQGLSVTAASIFWSGDLRTHGQACFVMLDRLMRI